MYKRLADEKEEESQIYIKSRKVVRVGDKRFGFSIEGDGVKPAVLRSKHLYPFSQSPPTASLGPVPLIVCGTSSCD